MKAVYLWLAALAVALLLAATQYGQRQAVTLTAFMIFACGGMIIYVCRAR